MSGLDAGDEICQVRAEAAGLAINGSPVFHAWLSTATTDAYCHIQGLTGKKAGLDPCNGATLIGGGPWVLVGGLPFSGDLDSLVDTVSGGPFIPPEFTETGSFTYFTRTLTGTAENGRYVPGFNCNDWSDATNSYQYVGGTTEKITDWSSGASSFCDAANLSLVCFEEGTGPAPPAPSQPGSLVFVTSETGSGDLASWTSSGGVAGLAGGDAVCQTLAASAGLPDPDTFFAWLSDSGTRAIDRLTTDGPWKRLDGYEIAAAPGYFEAGILTAPIWLDENGSRTAREVWTGTTSSGGTSTSTCGDWGEGISGDGMSGNSDRNSNRWTANAPRACNQQQSLYCFSNAVPAIFSDGFED